MTMVANLIATGHAGAFVDLEVLAAADPVQRLLQDANG